VSAFELVVVALLALIWRNTWRTARASMGMGNPRMDRALRWWLEDIANRLRPGTF
jgi:hypothetical protein